jgi:cell division protein FtsQ
MRRTALPALHPGSRALIGVAGGVGLRLVAWLAALAVVALPVVGVVNGWFASDRWPFKQLRVDATFERVNADQVRSVVSPHLGSGFFAVDLAAVRHAVEQVPWVETVEVRKRWPDLLEVRLIERRAEAVWGDNRLVSSNGELFAVPGGTAPEGLPQLDGPDTRVAEVLEFHRVATGLLEGTGQRPASVRLSRRGAWSVGLVSGAVLEIGRSDPRERLQRFVTALARIESAAPLLRADLRYANGFAIEWQPPTPPATPDTPPAHSAQPPHAET